MLIAPHPIIKRDKKILLIRRSITNPLWPYHWHCVTGKIEDNESPVDTLMLECKEEIGLDIQDMSLETTLFLRGQGYFCPDTPFRSIEFFFSTSVNNDAHPINIEPSKHDALEWADPNYLPRPRWP